MDSITEKYSVDQAATGSAWSEPVVSVRGLVKRDGRHEAVAGIDLEARRGEIFAFLGPNGAGKTTTVEILEGFQQRTAGQVSVLGTTRPRRAAPGGTGWAWSCRSRSRARPVRPGVPGHVRRVLSCAAGYRREHRPGRSHREGGRTRHQALRRPTALARSRPGPHRRPRAHLPDEPTTGFDPSARHAAWEVVAELRQLGKTVFLTTHYMDEAEYLAAGSRCSPPGASWPRACRRRWAGATI